MALDVPVSTWSRGMESEIQAELKAHQTSVMTNLSFPDANDAVFDFNQAENNILYNSGEPRQELAGEGAHEGSMPLLRRNAKDQRNQLTFFLGSSLAALLFVFFSTTGWLLTKRAAMLFKPPPPADIFRAGVDHSMEHVEKLWKNSSETVQKAFLRNFVPSMNDDEPPPSDVMALYKKQVEAMRAVKHPGDGATDEMKWQYETQRELVTSICNAVYHRLLYLTKLEAFLGDTNLPVPILGLEGTQLPSNEALEKEAAATEDGFTDFWSFLQRIPPQDGEVNFDVEECKKKFIPAELATRLSNLLIMDSHNQEEHLLVCRIFSPFAGAFGLRLPTMTQEQAKRAEPLKAPYDEIPFDSSIFLGFLHYRYRESRENCVDAGLLGEILGQWSMDGSKGVYEQLLGEQQRRVGGLLRQKRETLRLIAKDKPLPQDHLLSLALFLL